MNNPQILLNDILRIRKDFAAENIKLPPGLAGIYGEIITFQKLRKIFSKKDFLTNYYSGQKGADIQLIRGRDKINIEVKTSRLKEEDPGLVYGFAINVKKCIDHPTITHTHFKKGKIKGDFCYFDYLIAVTLSDNLMGPKFYIFPRGFLEDNEQFLRNKSKRFSSGSHRIIFIEKLKSSKEITRLDRRLTKNRKKYENAWHLIKPNSVNKKSRK